MCCLVECIAWWSRPPLQTTSNVTCSQSSPLSLSLSLSLSPPQPVAESEFNYRCLTGQYQAHLPTPRDERGEGQGGWGGSKIFYFLTRIELRKYFINWHSEFHWEFLLSEFVWEDRGTCQMRGLIVTLLFRDCNIQTTNYTAVLSLCTHFSLLFRISLWAMG